MISLEDFYSNMYDIEGLTHLSKRPKSTDETIISVERLVTENKCTEAKNIIRSVLDRKQVPELVMILDALLIKDKIFKAYYDDNRYDSNSPKRCALDEVSEYTGESDEVLLKKILVELPVKESWDKIAPDPDKKDDVDNFYMVTDAYIYELMAANHIIQTLYSYHLLAEKMLSLDIKDIMDYGGGAGTLCILFKEYGYDVDYADLPGKTFDFASWRFKRRGYSIPAIDLKSQGIGNYDCIICTEVFEHLVDPEELLKIFRGKISKGKYLVISESCEYTDDFSSHLLSNRKYGGSNFLKLMRRYGFSQIKVDPQIPQQIFKKD